MTDHTLRAALGVLMAIDADGRLKPHPQSPQAHVEPWEAEVLIAAMDIGDRYTDRDDNEVVLGWLAGAWILTVVIDQPAVEPVQVLDATVGEAHVKVVLC